MESLVGIGLTKSRRKAISKVAAVVIVVIFVVAAIAAIYVVTLKPAAKAGPITLAPSTLISSAGSPITFTVSGVESNNQANITFGDGHSALTSSSTTYSYPNPGRYLIASSESSSGSVVASTFNSTRLIQITPNVNSSFAPLISVPVITFNTTKNPSAPFVTTGETLYLSGSYLESPTGNDINITKYVWNFGDGSVQTVTADPSTFLPETNPVTTSYSLPGFYPVSLTIDTENVTSGQSYSYTIEATVAVSSSTQAFKLFEYSGNIPDPGVINVAENVAGGPFSFDPQVDYETVGSEVIDNIMGNLIIYNGSSTDTFLPMFASQVPSVANGEINSNYTSYTFQLRSGMEFSNGNPITSYDVYYTTIRALLFIGGAPGTPDWILDQYLVPGATAGVPIMTSATDSADFNAIMNSVTYSNSSDTVTFHLAASTPSLLFFQALADSLGAGVVDASWLQSIGAGITFTPAGFFNYQNEGSEGGYSTQVQLDPVASGPYMIQSYVPGQSVTLVRNPGFPGVPGIPAPNDTVVIQWVKDPDTAYNLFASGEADMLGGALPILPTNYFPLLTSLEANGQASLYQFPTATIFFYIPVLNFSVSLMKQDFGSQYNAPSDYFANTDVREAFTDAFNYTNFIDNIIGNSKYNVEFANQYQGAIPKGVTGYVPVSQLQNVSTYNLATAKALLQASGMYNVQVNIPIVVESGDSVDYAGAQMLAQAINSIDPNIVLTPTYVPFETIISYLVPGSNPMPIFFLEWIPDYPYPTDYVNAMYYPGGAYTGPDGWTAAYLNDSGYPAEAAAYTAMNNVIAQAESTSNATLTAQLFGQAEQMAINLYMYGYTFQPNSFWVLKPYMSGYQGQLSYEENPTIGGGADSLYYWWVKG